MKLKPDGRASDLNGFLDNGSYLEGELRFDAAFRVDGKLTGKVDSAGDLIVGETGEIDGELKVGQIFVSGTVRGTIRATARVQIHPSGKVFAEIETPALVIEDGAIFEGRCTMSREAVRGPAVPKLVAQKA